MSIDINQLLGNTLPVHLSVNHWDITHQISTVGRSPIPGDGLPAGAIPILHILRIATPITQSGSPTNYIHTAGGIELALSATTLTHTELQNPAEGLDPLTDAYVYHLDIDSNNITAGEFYLYTLYLQT